MSSNSSNKRGGIGVLGMLGIAFVVMKLAGIGSVAEWSWWWVTAPFWGVFALVAVILAAVVLIAFLSDLFGGKPGQRK